VKEGPSGPAIRSLIPSHRELLRAKSRDGERRGKLAQPFRKEWSTEYPEVLMLRRTIPASRVFAMGYNPKTSK
jgi:hypothetical protein